MIVPAMSATRPPAVSKKWLAILISATKSTTEKIMSAIPAAFASSVPNANSARITAMTPMMPGKMRLGLLSSKMIPYVPIVNSSTAICGSTMRWRKLSIGVGAPSPTSTPFVASVTVPAAVVTLRPSIFTSRSLTSLAITSTTPIFTASSDPMLTLLRTASSAHCSLRPRAFAMLTMCATASFSALRRRSPWMSPPDESTGWAAPMFVDGAIAATWPAMVMNVPADAARDPAGAT